MKLLAFSVHDSKVEAFVKPFFDVTRGSAIRAFSDAVNEEDSAFHRHAEDYTLFHVGSFDQELGVFEVFSAPVSLGNALTFMVEDTDYAKLSVD